jgi:hypothetical protein
MTYEETKTHSSGVAKAGLTLGIIGTALGGLLAANNGGWGVGGLLGGNSNVRAEAEQSTIAALGAEVAQLKSMRYTDQVGIDLYKNIVALSKEDDAKIGAVQTALVQAVGELDKKTALNEQAMTLNRAYDNMARDYQMTILNNKIDCLAKTTCMQAAFDRQLSGIADSSIVSYINSNFLPGQLKLPITSICPEPATATA